MAKPTKPAGDLDRGHMAAALGLARRGLGRTWPNPSVGCVILDAAGEVVGRGFTRPTGRPHAETEALKEAGDRARGGTAYVSLEPCAHHGETPPCAEALAKAGIARCVVAVGDPDPRVAGGGIAILERAGIEVVRDVLRDDAAELNAGFFRRVIAGRPLVTLKLATTLDGKIATLSGESKWITGPQARAIGHQLRASHDAILVGSGTVLADDPELACRLPGLGARSPVPVILDGRLRLPLSARLARPGTWLVTRADHGPATLAPYRQAGMEVIQVGDGEGGLDMASLMLALGRQGLTRLLVEGGAGVATALIRQDLADRLAWFQAPLVLGNDGMAAIAGMAVSQLDRAHRFTLLSRQEAGEDSFAFYRRNGS
ncbi:diaminohydroxyphosphoribosylaminopyrimidine deaminase/5-amino-6-(5-phosphoribosylamino)uracil reductase [Dongia mobilis]|uniref:Riboflavin biosynthesis protein RibD n=1 Tax=Dongia mobilis TaxID=578943 RepID=A0A4V3DEE6_9PROT|nr:bifunctional diaminohydroxyphosphoribosylaminopyrimidine deaminase/5-amino-6-(5-phosphoribosylamino)uracil reductase RibD [Dongia mobilis]TDQ80952.1 diaminohydroxyphosphoribosylaminopyrimidine deaminase/5-amino-6-(5-phosphoribosylamino)uracil reductase [Dongia mobilis]